MGKEVVYCDGCGLILREEEFSRGLAHIVDHRPLCAGCRRLYSPPPTPTFPVAASFPKRATRRAIRSALPSQG